MTDMGRAHTSAWFIWLGLALYAVLRLLLVPADGTITNSFNHDSAYIAIVADNLLAGRGLVNDAHWLVFLQPEKLPMPYHNANPLYPLLTAGVAWLTNRDTVWAGLAISALSSPLLLAALFVMTGAWTSVVWQRVFLSLAGTFFPTVFVDSWHMIPDALCTALTAWFVVCVIRGRGVATALLAGVLFGLAWLTRSSAITILPAALVLVLLRDGLRPSIVRGFSITLTALVVASPWFVHTAQVWGHPLRSDAGYYLMQDYHARAFDNSLPHFWHNPTEPPRLSEVLRSQPGEFLAFYVKSIPTFVRNAIGELSRWSFPVAGLLAALGLLGLWCARKDIRFTPELAALVVYALTALLLFTPRAQSLEVRYLAPLSIALGMTLMYFTLHALSNNKRPALAWITLAFAAAWWLVWSPWQDAQAAINATERQRHGYIEQAGLREIAWIDSHSKSVVVGHFPYFFTHATGISALSIPTSDDAFLIDYMRRYSAHAIYLTIEERDFWRPHWRDPANLPPQLRLVWETDFVVLYELKQ